MLTALCMAISTAALAADVVLDVKDFGALGDGRHIDSPAINAALLKQPARAPAPPWC